MFKNISFIQSSYLCFFVIVKLTHFFKIIYNTDTNVIYVDGEVSKVTVSEFYDSEEASAPTPFKPLLKSSPWDPVYQATYKIDFGKTVSSLSLLVGFVGAVLAGAYLAGFAIAASTISAKIGAWLSIVGFGRSWVPTFVGGKWSYSLYRTKSLVPTGYGSNQYAYRYQSSKLSFTLKNKDFYDSFSSVGNWWFGSKPY